jgi:hypothetical protein
VCLEALELLNVQVKRLNSRRGERKPGLCPSRYESAGAGLSGEAFAEHVQGCGPDSQHCKNKYVNE